ncbi:MAG: LPS export ABC transporter permease LptF [Arsenophonus sp. ET-YP4-MAG3]
MIIIRYLIKETLKNQVPILFILILIFFSKKTINILNAAVQGNISSNLVFPLLWLGIPEMVQLILPLSLFLGLLLTYSKLYINSEIIVMHACGLSKKILVIAALILALFTTIIAIINVMWMLPWSSKYQEQVLTDAKTNPNLANIVEGRFKTNKNKNIVLYLGNVKGNNFTDVFIAQLAPVNNKPLSVIIAKSGRIQEDKNGNKIIILDKGIYYEGMTFLRDFRITSFKNYQTIINYKETVIKGDKIEQKDMLQLWYATDTKSKVEFYWRLTLIISIFIMTLIVVPLTQINTRNERAFSMFSPILLYMIFFLLQSTLHSNAEKGKIDPKMMMLLVNGFFLLLAIILNIWDTFLIRQLRFKFHQRAI